MNDPNGTGQIFGVSFVGGNGCGLVQPGISPGADDRFEVHPQVQAGGRPAGVECDGAGVQRDLAVVIT